MRTLGVTLSGDEIGLSDTRCEQRFAAGHLGANVQPTTVLVARPDAIGNEGVKPKRSMSRPTGTSASPCANSLRIKSLRKCWKSARRPAAARFSITGLTQRPVREGQGWDLQSHRRLKATSSRGDPVASNSPPGAAHGSPKKPGQRFGLYTPMTLLSTNSMPSTQGTLLLSLSC